MHVQKWDIKNDFSYQVQRNAPRSPDGGQHQQQQQQQQQEKRNELSALQRGRLTQGPRLTQGLRQMPQKSGNRPGPAGVQTAAGKQGELTRGGGGGRTLRMRVRQGCDVFVCLSLLLTHLRLSSLCLVCS